MMRVIFHTSSCPVRISLLHPRSALRRHRYGYSKGPNNGPAPHPGTNTRQSMPGRSPSNESQTKHKVRGIFSPRACRLVLRASVQCSSVRETFPGGAPVSLAPGLGSL